MSIELYIELRSLLQRQATPDIEEVKVLIARYTETDFQEAVLHKDYTGMMLIHHACYGDVHVAVIQLLLDSDAGNNSIFKKNIMGWLPIHAACEDGTPVENVRLLMDRDADKKTLLMKDTDGRVPLHTACDKGGSVELIQLLLRASICDRIEQLDFPQWKLGVQELINQITQEDSRRNVQEIFERLSKYEMEHTMYLLALAVWRTSCLHWGVFEFISMQGIEYLGATDGPFDPAEYKRERRIKSGADVIIHRVLPFIPVNEEMPAFPDPDFMGDILKMETQRSLVDGQRWRQLRLER